MLTCTVRLNVLASPHIFSETPTLTGCHTHEISLLIGQHVEEGPVPFLRQNGTVVPSLARASHCQYPQERAPWSSRLRDPPHFGREAPI